MERFRSKYTYQEYQFVRFTLGGFEFGIELKHLKEIVKDRESAAKAEAPAFIDGFISLRGLSVPVVDLRRRFSIAAEAEEKKVLVVSVEGYIVGLLVDGVKGIGMGGKELRVKSRPSERPWDVCAEALVETKGEGIVIIDPERVFTIAEKEQLKAPIQG